jgi:hypothetical protein
MKLANNNFCKSFSFLALSLLFFASCTKHSGSGNGTVASSTVLSLHTSDPSANEFVTDSFNYDVNGRLAGYRQSVYFGTPGAQSSDSTAIVFDFPGSSTIPSGYTLRSTPGVFHNPEESHLLYYDNQNRIIKDSMLDIQPGIGIKYTSSTINFRYGSNIIIKEQILKPPPSSSIVPATKDSLIISAAGNLTNDNLLYYYPGTNDSGNIYLINTFTGLTNPFYNKKIAASIGPLLSQICNNDFISLNIFITKSQGATPQNFETFSFIWSTDTEGRVSNNQYVDYPYNYAFHYKN